MHLPAVAFASANKAMKERSRLAHEQLNEHQIQTVEGVQTSIEELLRITREVLESRLRAALRVDHDIARQLALYQAIKDVELPWNRMLEILNDDHLA